VEGEEGGRWNLTDARAKKSSITAVAVGERRGRRQLVLFRRWFFSPPSSLGAAPLTAWAGPSTTWTSASATLAKSISRNEFPEEVNSYFLQKTNKVKKTRKVRDLALLFQGGRLTRNEKTFSSPVLCCRKGKRVKKSRRSRRRAILLPHCSISATHPLPLLLHLFFLLLPSTLRRNPSSTASTTPPLLKSSCRDGAVVSLVLHADKDAEGWAGRFARRDVFI
jgi:hypothetical protein